MAALSLHVTRMLGELARDIQKSSRKNKTDQTADFSLRISRVAKARATAGSLQLLRLLCHSVVLKCSSAAGNSTAVRNNNNIDLEEAFMYHTRGDLPCDQLSSRPLVNSILDFIVVVGKESDAINTPEVYDTIVLSFQLLLVLCGTQLYQKFESSSRQTNEKNHIHSILEDIFQDAAQSDGSSSEKVEMDTRNLRMFYASSRDSISQSSFRDPPTQFRAWTPQSVLETCLKWQIRRPVAPAHSIAHYYYIMAQSTVAARGREMRSPDGMYESHLVVHAAAPSVTHMMDSGADSEAALHNGQGGAFHSTGQQYKIIFDATKGVLTLSSTIILLPFRLLRLVYGALVHSKGRHSRGLNAVLTKKFNSAASSRTKDVLWLSDSILADLGSCFVLLLANNNRNRPNPFRTQLKTLVDNRWDHGIESMNLPDLPPIELDASSESLSVEGNGKLQDGDQSNELTLNFESLFEAFGRTLHTEVGALLLYTLIQSSPSFAESLVVRSDLDTLVLPLCRTLYFASQSNTYMAKDFAPHKNSSSSNTVLDIRSCPFRSQSQLYVIIILLLLFSQDPSFGRDAFRRIHVASVMWYKERQLKHINLGSILFLTLLRSLMFNLQRLRDPFMLSNTCAILMNLSPSIADMHEYAAMRLVSVTISVMKRHSKLRSSSSNANDDEEDLTTPLGMYSEVAHSLLSIITDCLSPRKIEDNLHVIYALVYHQADFIKIFKEKKLYSPKKAERILSIAHAASSLIQEESARSAPKALKVLEAQIDVLKKASEKKKKKDRTDDFNFTYEEDSDPETFFVPYLWEVIVCVVTSSTIEWRKNDIRAFALLEPEEVLTNHVPDEEASPVVSDAAFEASADDLV